VVLVFALIVLAITRKEKARLAEAA
jgi:hypothetical protein